MSYLESISKSLSSSSRKHGPSLYEPITYKSFISDNIPNSDFGIKKLNIYYNLSPAELYEHSLLDKESKITSNGSLVAYSGIKTGRSPKDKRIVLDDNTTDIWWGNDSPNVKMDSNTFLINRETTICYLNSLDKVFIYDGYAGWDKTNRIKVRVICERPYHALFSYNMFVEATIDELKNFNPDYTIYNAGKFPCNRFTNFMTSSTSIDFDFTRNEILILGTQYAGEMKKGIFSVMHYIMPKKQILSLHSSANESKTDGSVSIFFGLSGTGKTTLSADSTRNLIGDDEHCWTDTGIFNIEGGCYAKCINLSKKKEPEIWNAIKFGSLLENVIIKKNRNIDFDDITITPNTRVSYPIDYIENAKIPCVAKHPNNIILLTCDAFGILPPVSKLTKEQVMYYFISGYTSKIAGTEMGITEPEATFSSCFGEAFIIWHPLKYAKLLSEKMDTHNVNAWLVNTGWITGKYGEGDRCKLKYTRAIIKAINDNKLKNERFVSIPIFNLKIPENCNGIDKDIFYPKNLWLDSDKYDYETLKLAKMFTKNFKKYNLEDLEQYGPKI